MSTTIYQIQNVKKMIISALIFQYRNSKLDFLIFDVYVTLKY